MIRSGLLASPPQLIPAPEAAREGTSARSAFMPGRSFVVSDLKRFVKVGQRPGNVRSVNALFRTGTDSRLAGPAEAMAWAQEVVANQATVYLDTETTGLTANAEICDVAVVDGSGLVLFESLVAPTVPIPAEASAIHQIFDHHVTGKPTWTDVLPEVCKFLQDRLVIVYNAAFDWKMVAQNCHRIGGEPPAGEWQCAMLAYSAFRASPGHRKEHRWHKLDDAVASFGGAPGGHRAAADAQACLAVVRGMAAATWVPTRLWLE